MTSLFDQYDTAVDVLEQSRINFLFDVPKEFINEATVAFYEGAEHIVVMNPHKESIVQSMMLLHITLALSSARIRVQFNLDPK